MAQKIVIAELELNTKALQESNTKLIQDITRLREEQKALKKETGNLSTATDEQAHKFIENDAALKKLSGQYNSNKRLLAENQTGVKNLNNELATEAQNISQAREQNKRLLALRNQINEKTTAGKEAIKEINDKIDSNNNKIKDNVSELEKQKIGIGDYEGALRRVFPQLNGVIGNLKGFKNGLVAKKTALQASTTGLNASSKALKLFRIALISTGIGAIVVLIGSLVAGFLSTQKGIDTVNRSLAPLKGAFEGIIGVVQKLAVNVFGQLKDRWTITLNSLLIGITNLRIKWNEFTGDDEEAESLKAYKEQLEKELEPAVERLKKKNEELSQIWKNAGNDIKEAAKAQQEIVNLGIEIEKKENDLIISRATLLDQLKEQEEIAKNTTLTDAERLKAINEAEKISNKLADKEKEILDLKIKQKTLQNSLNDTDRDAEKELNQLIAQRTQKQTENRARTLKFLGSRNSLEKQRQSNAKKAVDNAIKESKTLLNIFIAEQGVRAKTLSEELKLAEKISEKKKQILKAELKANKITQSEFNLAILQLDNALLSKRANLAVDNARRELQLFKDNHQSKLNANTFFSEELLNQEITRLDLLAQKEREYHKKRLEKGVINQQEYNDAINAVDKENRIAKEDLQLKRKQAKKEKEIIDLENQRIIDEENFNNQFDLQLSRLKLSYEAEKKSAEKTGADTALITKKYTIAKQKIEDAARDTKLNSDGQAFGKIADFIGQESALGKAAALAQAGINIQLGITKALASKGFLGIVEGAIIAAKGAISIGKITGISTKFEKGGLQEIGGKRHSQGGTKFYGEDGTAFEAEQGELIGVMNRNASRLFMEFNDKYRAGGMVKRHNVFSSGGFVQRSIVNNNGVNNEQLKSAFSEALQNMPNPIVSVVDITDGQGSYTEVVDGANIS